VVQATSPMAAMGVTSAYKINANFYLALLRDRATHTMQAGAL